MILTLLWAVPLPAVGEDAASKKAKDIEQLDFANGLFERELYPMAISEYKKFIRRHGKSEKLHEAYFAIAESYFFSQEYKRAVSGYEEYLERFPKTEKKEIAMVRLGQSHFLLNQPDEAIKVFTAISGEGLSPQFLQALNFYLGKAQRMKGMTEEAIKSFEMTVTILDKSEDTVYAFLEIGDLLAQGAKYNEAWEAYTKALDRAESDPLKSLAAFKRGRVKFLSGDYPASVEIFKNVLKSYPKEEIVPDALANLLLALFNLEKYDDLIKEYKGHEHLVKFNGIFFDAFYPTFSAHSALGRYEEALGLIDKVLTVPLLKPEDRHETILKKGEVLIKMKRFEEAVAFLNKEFEASYKDDAHILFLKAEAHYGFGRFDEAYDFYEKIQKKFETSIFADEALYGMAYCKNSLQKDKEAMELFFEYYKVGKDQAKREEALYNEILLSKKNNENQRTAEHCELYIVTFTEAERYESVLFLLGTVYAQLLEHDKAVSTFQRYITEFPKSEKLSEANFFLAYNLQLSNKADEALAYYQKLTPQDTNKKLFYPALKNTAFIYLNKDKKEEAAAVFDQIILTFDENDLDVTTYLWLGEKYVTEKRFEQALRIMQRATALNKAGDQERGVAFFTAEAYRGLGDCVKALEQYAIVLQPEEDTLGPYSGLANIGQGLCLMATKDFTKARDAFDTAILQNAQDPAITMRARFEIANLSRLSGQLQEASKFYMLVAVLYDDAAYCPQALFEAGKVFEELEKKEDALKVYEEILQTYADSAWVDKAKERISALNAG